MASFPEPLKAKAGTKGSRDLVDDHAERIVELQDAVDRLALANPDVLLGEDTEFRAIKDGDFVRYIIKAILSDTDGAAE